MKPEPTTYSFHTPTSYDRLQQYLSQTKCSRSQRTSASNTPHPDHNDLATGEERARAGEEGAGNVIDTDAEGLGGVVHASPMMTRFLKELAMRTHGEPQV